MNNSAVFDSVIRLATIVVRGIFVFAAAKYLSPWDFGSYVAVSAVIALLQYAVAGDFSYIAHREFFLNRIKFEEILRTQAVLMGLLFIISGPIAIYLLPSGITLQASIVTLFILICEALTSEIQRHLAAISKFTRANLMLFIKSAGWMLPTLLIFVTDFSYSSLEFILYFWIAGLVASLLVGLGGIDIHNCFRAKANKLLLQLYLKKVLVVLIGTLAARSLFSLDRIIVEKLIGIEEAGAYGLFVGIAAAFVAIVDAGVLTRSYPDLVRLGVSKFDEYKALSNKVNYKILIITLLAITVYVTSVSRILSMVEKDEYSEFMAIGLLLIIAYGIYSMSFPYNCRLYALGKDKLITAINIISLAPLCTIFYSSALDATRIASAVVACASLHYVLRYLSIQIGKYKL